MARVLSLSCPIGRRGNGSTEVSDQRNIVESLCLREMVLLIVLNIYSSPLQKALAL